MMIGEITDLSYDDSYMKFPEPALLTSRVKYSE
jgi:hypothetical protein